MSANYIHLILHGVAKTLLIILILFAELSSAETKEIECRTNNFLSPRYLPCSECATVFCNKVNKCLKKIRECGNEKLINMLSDIEEADLFGTTVRVMPSPMKCTGKLPKDRSCQIGPGNCGYIKSRSWLPAGPNISIAENLDDHDDFCEVLVHELSSAQDMRNGNHQVLTLKEADGGELCPGNLDLSNVKSMKMMNRYNKCRLQNLNNQCAYREPSCCYSRNGICQLSTLKNPDGSLAFPECKIGPSNLQLVSNFEVCSPPQVLFFVNRRLSGGNIEFFLEEFGPTVSWSRSIPLPGGQAKADFWGSDFNLIAEIDLTHEGAGWANASFIGGVIIYVTGDIGQKFRITRKDSWTIDTTINGMVSDWWFHGERKKSGSAEDSFEGEISNLDLEFSEFEGVKYQKVLPKPHQIEARVDNLHPWEPYSGSLKGHVEITIEFFD